MLSCPSSQQHRAINRWLLPDNMDPHLLQTLLAKYRNDTATDEEKQFVDAWYDALDATDSQPLAAAEQTAFVERHWQQMAGQLSTDQPVRGLSSRPYIRVAAAAAVVLLLGLGWFGYRQYLPHTTGTIASITTSGPATLIDQTNRGTQPMSVALSDGSRITLQPGGRVQYPARFAAGQRIVRLEGVAFFEVQKDPDRPFMVFANGMVTKVLGTSFTIFAKTGKPTAEVVVRTGRVAVFRQTDDHMSTSNLVLKPNEKATFYRTDNRIVKALADQPVVLKPEAVRTHFVYNDTPVTDVFRELQEVYGITIAFDQEAFANCTLTANIANQPLNAQLNMICLSIGARHQTQGTQVYIGGHGCP